MAPQASDLKNGPCRWGIIGGGNVCEHKGGPPLYQVAGCQLLGVTRRNRAAGEDFARRHGPCRYFDSVEALLAEPGIECIYVASPVSAHAAHVAAAADAGKQVLCEKPMAKDSEECAKMVTVCRENRVTLAVAYYRRGYPSVQRAMELLRSTNFGPLQAIWLNTQFPISHRLDLVQFFGGDIKSVQLESSDSGEAALLAHTASGARMQTSLKFEETTRTEQIRLICERGEIFISDLKGGTLSTIRGAEHSETHFDPLPATHWGLVENFREHLRSGTPLLCDGETGRKSSVVLDVVSNLERPGQALAIDYAHPPGLNPELAARYKLLA
jgi:predicted dehydrogenase